MLSHWRHNKRKIQLLLAGLVIVCCFDSCAPTKCVLCEMNNTKIYKVKLKKEGKDQIGKDKVFTNYYPITIKRSKNKSDVYVIDCERKEPYLLEGKELEDFIKENLYVIDRSKVDTIIDTGDSDYPLKYILATPIHFLLSYATASGNPLNLNLGECLGYAIF